MQFNSYIGHAKKCQNQTLWNKNTKGVQILHHHFLFAQWQKGDSSHTNVTNQNMTQVL